MEQQQQSSFQMLISLLSKIILTYRALYTVADQKKAAIIANDIEDVNRLSLQETKMLKPVPDMEKEVRQLLTAIQRELGFRPKLKMSLDELITLLIEPEQKQLLQETGEELVDISNKLKAANELNYHLTQQSLEYVNFSLDVLVGPEEEEYTYKKPMQQQEPLKRSSLYDKKL